MLTLPWDAGGSLQQWLCFVCMQYPGTRMVCMLFQDMHSLRGTMADHAACKGLSPLWLLQPPGVSRDDTRIRVAALQGSLGDPQCFALQHIAWVGCSNTLCRCRC